MQLLEVAPPKAPPLLFRHALPAPLNRSRPTAMETVPRADPLGTGDVPAIVQSMLDCIQIGEIHVKFHDDRVRSLEAKTLVYQRLAEQRQDTTSQLHPSYYGLANQINTRVVANADEHDRQIT